MATEPDTNFGDRVVAVTETYVEELERCVSLLPELLERYEAGGRYRETADGIRSHESECDRLNRLTGALVTGAGVEELGIRNTRMHLNSPQVLELFQRLDEVANGAERVAETLVTTRPDPATPPFRRYRAMAEYATTATAALGDAVRTFVRLLCAPSASERGVIGDEMAAVRAAESDCDGVRNEAVEAAFEAGSVDRPLLHREFALLLDGVVDAAEDATDQLVLVSSTEDWISTEPDRQCLAGR